MSASTGELVLVVPRAQVMPADWRGVLTGQDAIAHVLAAIGVHGRFAPRDEMEHDPAFKQVIPYLVLRDGDRWFLMRRTRAGGDLRLHDRWSIGVGGHLNPGDQDLAGGLLREWREELAADFVPLFQPFGLLNDDEDPVGAVHLGIVVLADAAGRPVTVRETDKLGGSFATTAQIASVYDAMESWSQLCFDALSAPPGVGAEQTAYGGGSVPVHIIGGPRSPAAD